MSEEIAIISSVRIAISKGIAICPEGIIAIPKYFAI